MKKISLLFIFIFSLLLVGCNENEILKKEGTVFEKEFRPEGIVYEQEYYNSRLKNYEITYPDRYIIYVKYKEDFGNLSNPFYKTYAFYVSKDIFENTNIGDSYLYNEYKDSLDINYIRKVEVNE